MPNPPPDFRQVALETAEAIALLRHRLRTILDRLLPDGYGARSLGRALDVEQTTAWRCWRIAHVADPAAALQVMPGRRAWESIFRRFEARGVHPRELKALREAFARIEPLIFGRRADRMVLRAIAGGGLDSKGELAALRPMRQAVSRGNARLYGVHAKTVVLSWMIAPGPSRGSVSLGVAGVIDGLRRLRPGPSWPVLQRSVASRDRKGNLLYYEPLGDDPALPSTVRGGSTRNPAGGELRAAVRHGQETIDLGEVPPDRNGRLRPAHAEILRHAGDLPPDTALPVCLTTPVLLPVDSIIFDLCFHRDIARHTEPSASLLVSPISIERIMSVAEATRVPMETEMRTVATTRLPGRRAEVTAAHLETLRRVAASQHATPDDYEVHRLVLPHPPLFASITGEFELASLPRPD